MLFNATQAEELRVAIVDGQTLIDLDIESASKEQRKSNIYKGVVTRIEPSLEAAFVDYGTERHGFLPFKEVARAYFRGDLDPARARIQDALKEGQEVIVQVDKDERGSKGAALTTFISLAGRYLVLMPNNPRGGGVSRRVEGEERNELREVITQLDIPQGMSVIARTAGIGRTVEELQWDMNYLLQLWHAIEDASRQQNGAFLIYQESSLVIRAIRDYYQPDIGEILIDAENIYDQARQFMGHVMPANISKVKLYRDDVPLFSRFQIEHQIETAYAREVSLPSGGALVIDHTEALVAVDVNSARATRGADIEQTALHTNLEAADEIARQLRLRDLGGLIVIDFIDMESGRNQRDVENRLRDALKYDRARVQMGKISRFGMMELSRQRLQPSLGETSHISCPRCMGTGFIRGIESSGLHILRIIQEEAMKENTGAVHVQVPVDVATFMLNEKRAEIHAVEARMKVNVVLIPNIHLETPQYQITRLRHDELNKAEIVAASYELVEKPSDQAQAPQAQEAPKAQRQEAVVRGITPAQPAPIVEEKKEKTPTLVNKIFGWLKNIGGEKQPMAAESRPRHQRRDRGREPARGRHERRERLEGRGAQPQRHQPSAFQQQRPRAEGRQPAHQEHRPKPPAAPREEPGSRPAMLKETPGQEPAESFEHRGRRGRRGRGGRREREQREAPPQRPAQEAVETRRERPVAPDAPRFEPVPPAAAPLPAAPSAPAEMAAEKSHAAAPATPGPSEPRQLPRPAPKHEERVYALPTNQVDLTPAATDLVQIETDPGKTRAGAPDVTAEPPAAPKPARVRPAPPPEETEPLVQIETRKSE